MCRSSTNRSAKMGTFSRAMTSSRRGARHLYMPGGQDLTTTGHVSPDHSFCSILCSVPQCRACPLKAKCCPKMPARRVKRDVREAARDVALTLAKTLAFSRITTA